MRVLGASIRKCIGNMHTIVFQKLGNKVCFGTEIGKNVARPQYYTRGLIRNLQIRVEILVDHGAMNYDLKRSKDMPLPVG